MVGSGPFRLVEGTAGGSTYRVRGQPGLLGRRPARRPGGVPGLQERGPAIQALIKGEIDFVDDITPAPGRGARRDARASHAQNGVSPVLRGDRLQHRRGRPRDRRADRRRQPGAEGPGVPARPRLRARPATGSSRRAYQGAAVAGRHVHPAGLRDYRWEPPEDEAFTFDLEKAGELLDEAGYEVGADGLRTMPDGSPIGTLRLFARAGGARRPPTIMEFFQEWLGEIGIESEVRVMESNQLTDVILEGNFDAFHWGWFVEPDPDSILSVLHSATQRGGSSDSWYCNEEYDELYAAQNAEVDDAKRIEMVKQMQEIIFRGRALPRHGVHDVRRRPSAPTGSRASSRSRTPAASCWSSTAPQLHACSARPTRPATATASTSAIRAASAASDVRGRRRAAAPASWSCSAARSCCCWSAAW